MFDFFWSFQVDGHGNDYRLFGRPPERLRPPGPTGRLAKARSGGRPGAALAPCFCRPGMPFAVTRQPRYNPRALLRPRAGPGAPRRASPANTHLLPMPVAGVPQMTGFGHGGRREAQPRNHRPAALHGKRAAAFIPSGGRFPHQESCNAPSHHAPDAGSRRPFRPPDPLLEPQDGAVHLRRPRQDPHHQP